MSTSCTIAIQDDHGRYRSIYCNRNGFPSYMLEILNEKFKRHSQASLLIKGGDIRFIDHSGKADDYLARGKPWAKIKPREYSDNRALMRETAYTNYAYIFIGGQSGNWIGA